MKGRVDQQIANDRLLLDIEKTNELISTVDRALEENEQQALIAALYAFIVHVDSTLGNKYRDGFKIATKGHHRDFSIADYESIFSQTFSRESITLSQPLRLKALEEAIMHQYIDASDPSSHAHKYFTILNELKNAIRLIHSISNNTVAHNVYPADEIVKSFKPALTLMVSQIYLDSPIGKYATALENLDARLTRLDDADIKKSAGRAVYDAAIHAVNKHPEKLRTVTHAIKTASIVIENPNKENIKSLHHQASHLSQRNWGKMLAGTMLALAGVTMAVGFTAVALVSFGALAPVSILGFTLGASMLAGGFAVAGGAVGLGTAATGAGFFASGARQGKETRQLRTNMEKLANTAKRAS